MEELIERLSAKDVEINKLNELARQVKIKKYSNRHFPIV